MLPHAHSCSARESDVTNCGAWAPEIDRWACHAPHAPHVPHENRTSETVEHGRRRPVRWPSDGSPSVPGMSAWWQALLLNPGRAGRIAVARRVRSGRRRLNLAAFAACSHSFVGRGLAGAASLRAADSPEAEPVVPTGLTSYQPPPGRSTETGGSPRPVRIYFSSRQGEPPGEPAPASGSAPELRSPSPWRGTTDKA
jgi:hypothetical protein